MAALGSRTSKHLVTCEGGSPQTYFRVGSLLSAWVPQKLVVAIFADFVVFWLPSLTASLISSVQIWTSPVVLIQLVTQFIAALVR